MSGGIEVLGEASEDTERQRTRGKLSLHLYMNSLCTLAIPPCNVSIIFWACGPCTLYAVY